MESYNKIYRLRHVLETMRLCDGLTSTRCITLRDADTNSDLMYGYTDNLDDLLDRYGACYVTATDLCTGYYTADIVFYVCGNFGL